jgi:exopolysaccharide biosynthesis polyprenyl glycosylphosphotransferase
MYSRSILFERAQLALLRGLATVAASFASVWTWHTIIEEQAVASSGVYLMPSLVAAATVIAITWFVPSRFLTFREEAASITKSVLLAVLVLMALSFFLRGDTYSRGTALVFIPMTVLALLAADAADRWISTKLRLSASASRRVLLVGFGEHGQRVAASLALRPVYYTVVGYLDRRTISREGDIEVPRLGSLDDVQGILADHSVDEAIIAIGYASDQELQELIGICMANNISWRVMPPMLDLCLDQVQFDTVGGLPIVGERGSQLVGYNWYLKRAFDILGSVLLLILLSPLMAAAAIAVRATSRGPVIFRQTRVGLKEDPFTLYKFRTMEVGNKVSVHQSSATEWVFGDAEADAQGNGASHKNGSDQRVTSVGRILRAASIDELPQLWNVTKGEMSLVGPRPPIDYEVEQYAEWHKRRLEVPPGMTGLWQVSGRNSLSFDEMVTLDIDYIDSWSVGLDIRILLRTIPTVVVDRGR